MSRQLKHVLIKNKKKVLTIMIHGFMGNHKDLEHIARSPEIAEKTDCLLMDLTNHGESYHQSDFNWNEMTEDVFETYETKFGKEYEQSGVWGCCN